MGCGEIGEFQLKPQLPKTPTLNSCLGVSCLLMDKTTNPLGIGQLWNFALGKPSSNKNPSLGGCEKEEKVLKENPSS
jgi:hypothetical protein